MPNELFVVLVLVPPVDRQQFLPAYQRLGVLEDLLIVVLKDGSEPGELGGLRKAIEKAVADFEPGVRQPSKVWTLHRFDYNSLGRWAPTDLLGLFTSWEKARDQAVLQGGGPFEMIPDPTMPDVFCLHSRTNTRGTDPQPSFLIQQLPVL